MFDACKFTNIVDALFGTVEQGGELAAATEEQAVRKLYPDEMDIVNYDGPSLMNTWLVDEVRAAA